MQGGEEAKPTPDPWPGARLSPDGFHPSKADDGPHPEAATEWWYVNAHFCVEPPKSPSTSPVPLLSSSAPPLSASSSSASSLSASCSDLRERYPWALFACFFRTVKGFTTEKYEEGELRKIPQYAYALNWALIDAKGSTYTQHAIVDPDAHEVVQKQIQSHKYKMDPRLAKAFTEALQAHKVPRPDREFEDMVRTTMDKHGRLSLNFGGNTFNHNVKTGVYNLSLRSIEKGTECLRLSFAPEKPAYLQGERGTARIGRHGEKMKYYFFPSMSVSGSLDSFLLKTCKDDVKSGWVGVRGKGWYDHEFGGQSQGDIQTDESTDKVQINNGAVCNSIGRHILEKRQSQNSEGFTWTWFSLQLSGDFQVTASKVMDPIDPCEGKTTKIEKNEKSDTQVGKIIEEYVILIGPDNKRLYAPASIRCIAKVEDSKSEGRRVEEHGPVSPWISVRTSQEYSLAWTIEAQELGLSLDVRASFEEQEFLTLISKPSYWEGRVDAKGTLNIPLDSNVVSDDKNEKRLEGIGFLEIKGRGDLSSLATFFQNISVATRREIARILPLHPSPNHLRDMIGNRTDYAHLSQGLESERVVRTLIQPLRDLIDRGGKAWRSFALTLSIDCVGGDSRKYRHLLALPEILHCGSLIIDDIQDNSKIRRGGPTCHEKYGLAAAINAGTASYFHAINIVEVLTPGISASTRLEIYQLYFIAMRAGHCGQGLDIDGLWHMMDDVVETGNTALLEEEVLRTHRLKSGVPAGCLARMGAILGGGSESQQQQIGNFFEILGVAFQIVDDVLSLRGFKGKAKAALGEDITSGKITYPVACAMRTEHSERVAREKLWKIVKLRTDNPEEISEALKIVESCGAMDRCMKKAKEMLDKAWEKIDRVLPASYYKIMLRAFAYFVLERHY